MNDNHYVVRVDNFDALKDKLQMILDESCQGETLEPRYMKQFLTINSFHLNVYPIRRLMRAKYNIYRIINTK